MMVKGAPPSWPWLLRLLPATFQPRFDAAGVGLALLVTVGAVLLLGWLRAQPARGLASWVVGLTTAWTLLTTLWMPWLDFAKSYRSVFAAMPIPQRANCIASYNLGEGERAMLRYVTGRNPMRLEVHPAAGCDTLLVQREAAYGEPEVDLGRWKELWRGSRPGVTNERFFLFRIK
jgi:4-amino-4-deoxy-L-arabinose transferase-like glycosyltransferase